MQSHEEMSRIWTDWVSLYAPKTLINSDHTQRLLADYVIKHYGGIPSFTALNAAVVALASQVLTPELTPAQIEANLAAKERARTRKDYLDSLKPHQTMEISRTAQQRLDDNKKAANEKELKSLVSQIEFEISNFSVGHSSGSLDYSRTEYGRDSLRKVRDAHSRGTIEGAKATLSAVRAAKNRL